MASCYFYFKDTANFRADARTRETRYPKLLTEQPKGVCSITFSLLDNRSLNSLSRVSKACQTQMQTHADDLFAHYSAVQRHDGITVCPFSEMHVHDRYVFSKKIKRKIAVTPLVFRKLEIIRTYLNGPAPLSRVDIICGNENTGMNLITWLAHVSVEIGFPQNSARAAYSALNQAFKLGADVKNRKGNDYLGVKGDPINFIYRLDARLSRLPPEKYPAYARTMLLLIKYAGEDYDHLPQLLGITPERDLQCSTSTTSTTTTTTTTATHHKHPPHSNHKS